MHDAHREKLDKRLTPIELFKLTPRTNCGACGFATCLAFATQVIVGQADLDACAHLDPGKLAPFRVQLQDQQKAGIGLKREGFEKALEFLRGEIRKWDLVETARSVGGEAVLREGEPALRLAYFGSPVIVTHEDIGCEREGSLSPWEKIFLFNYVIGGAVEPSGDWVGMESFPNSISKIKSLKTHCEDRLSEAAAHRMEHLAACVAGIGVPLRTEMEHADFGAEFRILPKLAVRILWWDEDPEEGFQAKAKFLFDSRAVETLDLESLLFACEQLTDRILSACFGAHGEGHTHAH